MKISKIKLVESLRSELAKLEKVDVAELTAEASRRRKMLDKQYDGLIAASERVAKRMKLTDEQLLKTESREFGYESGFYAYNPKDHSRIESIKKALKVLTFVTEDTVSVAEANRMVGRGFLESVLGG